MERLISDAPGDTRRLLRRFAEANLGLFQVPSIEALGGRVSRNMERLTGAIVSAGLIIGGSNMITTPEIGWHHLLGEMLVGSGVLGSIIISIGALRSDRGRGRGRR